MLIRKMIRTAISYKAQFISMIIMVAIGIGVFIGFNVEWKSIEHNVDNYLDKTNFTDYRVYSETTFSDIDIENVRSIDGVDKATRWLSVNANVKDENKTLSINVVEDYGVSSLVVTKGKAYSETEEGIYLSDQYARANKIKIGDTITLVYNSLEISQTVISLVKSPEFIVCTQDKNQIMPDYKTFGYLFVTPKTFKEIAGFEIYTQINIKSDLSHKEIEKRINEKFEQTILVTSNEENVGYVATRDEIQQGKTMGSVLPVLFLLIAVLTMATTMQRITSAEKTQIGTLKALGFKNRRIIFNYSMYGVFIGILGGIMGIGIGFLIAYIIINPTGMMATYFDLPSWDLVMPSFIYLILVATIAFLMIISILSVMKILKGTPADVLRPYVPKKTGQIWLEKFKIWKKLSFGTKWNTRDIIRHKARSLMTLIGVIGCMLLLVGGLGMKDTMKAYMDVLTKDSINYKTKINLSETIENDKAIEIANNYEGDYGSTIAIQYDEENISLEIYETSGKVNFVNRNDKRQALNNNGVYVCVRIADSGVKKGDIITFSPYGSSSKYNVVVEGVIRSTLSKNIVMTAEYANTIGIDYRIDSIYTDVLNDDIVITEDISSIQDCEAIIDSYNYFMEIMNTMVYVLVLAAVVLGIVVLYNLGIMSYVERYRELATLKVVGFKNKHIAKILISQNLWLTIIGIIIGLPLGYLVLNLLVDTLGENYELKVTMGVLTYTVSILVTLGVSLVVSFFVAKKNKQVNMVEALKGAE